MVCPSCGEFLGNNQILFDNAIDYISELDIDDTEKQKLKTKFLKENIGIKRYCCTIRMLTYTKLIDFVK